MSHYSVLLKESVDLLVTNEDGIYVDVTLGGGGHTREILSRLSSQGRLIAFDQDQYAIDLNKEQFSSENRLTIIKSNFSNIKEKLFELGIQKVDGIIADLGVSSFQLDIEERGFSYRSDNILDMRMDQNSKVTAKDIVNTYEYKELCEVLRKYGDEKFASPIVNRILKYRMTKEIATTFQLNDIIKSALPQRELRKKGHPSKKVFQALRIEVNKEMEVLEGLLDSSLDLLAPEGRLVVITFHSLEDRIVKHFIKKWENPCTCPKDFPRCVCGLSPKLVNLTRKPIEPSFNELNENNRSHSSKLRACKRLED